MVTDGREVVLGMKRNPDEVMPMQTAENKAPRVAYKEVLRQVGDHGEIRERVLRLFRDAGGDADRWRRPDLEAMADALTKVEDDLENESRGKMTAGRMAARIARRRLEAAVWP